MAGHKTLLIEAGDDQGAHSTSQIASLGSLLTTKRCEC
jgi:hypothetical protein